MKLSVKLLINIHFRFTRKMWLQLLSFIINLIMKDLLICLNLNVCLILLILECFQHLILLKSILMLRIDDFVNVKTKRMNVSNLIKFFAQRTWNQLYLMTLSFQSMWRLMCLSHDISRIIEWISINVMRKISMWNQLKMKKLNITSLFINAMTFSSINKI
jgi:hypothetical protein